MRPSGQSHSRRVSPKSVARSETWESASTASSRRMDTPDTGSDTLSTWNISSAQEVVDTLGTPHSHRTHGQLGVWDRCPEISPSGPWDLPERMFNEAPPKQVPMAIKPFKVLCASDSQRASLSKQTSSSSSVVALGELPDWIRSGRHQQHSGPLPETIRDIMALDAPPESAEDPESPKRRYRRFRRSSSSRSSGSRGLNRSSSSISCSWEDPLNTISELDAPGATLTRGGTKGSADSTSSTLSSPGQSWSPRLERGFSKGSRDGSITSEVSMRNNFGNSRSSSALVESVSSEDADRCRQECPLSPALKRSPSSGSATTRSERSNTSRRRPSIGIEFPADSAGTPDGSAYPTGETFPASSSSTPAGYSSTGLLKNPSLRRSKSEKVSRRPAPRLNLRRAKTASPSGHGKQDDDTDPIKFMTAGELHNRCTPLPEGPEDAEREEAEEFQGFGAHPRHDKGREARGDGQRRGRSSLGRMFGRIRASISGKQGGSPIEAEPDFGVIILDWDDTLLPTSFIKQVVLHSLEMEDRDGPVPEGSPFFEDLQLHAGVVEELLRAASQVARVAIVTLATRWWVYASAERYLPGLDLNLLLQELNLTVYPADRGSALVKALAMSGRDPCKVAKKNAMLKCLKKLYGSSDSPWNVISIGDSTIEQEAIKECLSGSAKQKSLCKTVKLPESMSLADLRNELKQLVPLLPRLVSYSKDFDRTSGNVGNLERLSMRLMKI